MRKLLTAVITKIDEAKKEVWGTATQEVPDCTGEIFHYETSKPYFQAWSDNAAKITNGKSLGNLRYMHQLDVAGKIISIDFDDENRKINIGTKITDDQIWSEVVEGSLAGFSIGGSYIRTWADKDSDFLYFTAKPSEISIVDLPCCPVATFEMVKVDGSIHHLSFRTKEAKTKRVDGEDLTASCFLIVGDTNDPSTWKLPYKFSSDEKTESHLRNALARFNQLKGVSEEEKAKAWKKLKRLCAQHGIEVNDEEKSMGTSRLETLAEKMNQPESIKGAWDLLDSSSKKFEVQIAKSMYDVADLAVLLVQIRSIQSYQKWEADMEGEDQDNYAIADMLGRWLEDGVDILKELVEEETSEMTAS